MPPQTPGDVRQNRLAVFELDREGRTWKHLLDRPEQFEGSFLGGLLRGPGRPSSRIRAAASYDRTALNDIIWVEYTKPRAP